jgi:hypothetical protein
MGMNNGVKSLMADDLSKKRIAVFSIAIGRVLGRSEHIAASVNAGVETPWCFCLGD